MDDKELAIKFAQYFLFKKDYDWNRFHSEDIEEMENECLKLAEEFHTNEKFPKKKYVVKEYGSLGPKEFEYK